MPKTLDGPKRDLNKLKRETKAEDHYRSWIRTNLTGAIMLATMASTSENRNYWNLHFPYLHFPYQKPDSPFHPGSIFIDYNPAIKHVQAVEPSIG